MDSITAGRSDGAHAGAGDAEPVEAYRSVRNDLSAAAGAVRRRTAIWLGQADAGDGAELPQLQARRHAGDAGRAGEQPAAGGGVADLSAAAGAVCAAGARLRDGRSERDAEPRPDGSGAGGVSADAGVLHRRGAEPSSGGVQPDAVST